ncbi:MAG: hypothetical protein WD533_03760 [Dehalococcoidia bacterium]
MPERRDLDQETFLALAGMLGLDDSGGHLEKLFPEVVSLLALTAGVEGIDVADVPVEHAAASVDGGVDGGAV